MSVDLIRRYLTENLRRSSEEIPWPTLKFLIGEVMYGGRVIDSYDRRLIRTYMNEFFGDFVFDRQQTFHFFVDRYDYFLPEIRDFLSVKQRWLLKRSNIDVESTEKLSPSVFRDFFLNYVGELPRTNPPTVLGLNSNVEESFFSFDRRTNFLLDAANRRDERRKRLSLEIPLVDDRADPKEDSTEERFSNVENESRRSLPRNPTVEFFNFDDLEITRRTSTRV